MSFKKFWVLKNFDFFISRKNLRKIFLNRYSKIFFLPRKNKEIFLSILPILNLKQCHARIFASWKQFEKWVMNVESVWNFNENFFSGVILCSFRRAPESFREIFLAPIFIIHPPPKTFPELIVLRKVENVFWLRSV